MGNNLTNKAPKPVIAEITSRIWCDLPIDIGDKRGKKIKIFITFEGTGAVSIFNDGEESINTFDAICNRDYSCIFEGIAKENFSVSICAPKNRRKFKIFSINIIEQ